MTPLLLTIILLLSNWYDVNSKEGLFNRHILNVIQTTGNDYMLGVRTVFLVFGQCFNIYKIKKIFRL